MKYLIVTMLLFESLANAGPWTHLKDNDDVRLGDEIKIDVSALIDPSRKVYVFYCSRLNEPFKVIGYLKYNDAFIFKCNDQELYVNRDSILIER